MVNQEIGSIMGYCYSKWQTVVYTNRIPEKFAIPCIYFPPPIVVDGSDTLSTFLKTYTMAVKIFHKNSPKAVSKADEIADFIRTGRYLIPMLNPDGGSTGKYIRIKRADVRQVDDGVALMTVTWSSRHYYTDTLAKDWVSIPEFVPGMTYYPGDHIIFENAVYECLEKHTVDSLMPLKWRKVVDKYVKMGRLFLTERVKP